MYGVLSRAVRWWGVQINNIGTMLWVGDMVQGKGENKGATIVSDLFGVSMYLAGSFRKQTTFGYDERLAHSSAPAGNLPDAYLMEFKDPMTPGASMAFLCRSIQVTPESRTTPPAAAARRATSTLRM
jgi:hypothetical protein